MKIGLISDIHNHTDALERALELLQRQSVDLTVCMGDVVELGRGDAAARTIAVMQKMGIPSVQGNHDVRMIAHQRKLRDALVLSDTMRGQWLDDKALAYLEKLPHALNYTWEGQHVYITHAAPWSKDVHLSARHPAQYQRLVKEAQADVILLGHTHIAVHIELNGVHIVNPGAVWSDLTETYRTCGIVTLPRFSFQVYDLYTGQLFMTTTQF